MTRLSIFLLIGLHMKAHCVFLKTRSNPKMTAFGLLFTKAFSLYFYPKFLSMVCCRYFRLQKWFDVDFYIERILTFFGLATVLATFSKNWAVFIQSSDHTEHCLAYFATVVSYGRNFL